MQDKILHIAGRRPGTPIRRAVVRSVPADPLRTYEQELAHLRLDVDALATRLARRLDSMLHDLEEFLRNDAGPSPGTRRALALQSLARLGRLRDPVGGASAKDLARLERLVEDLVDEALVYA